MMQNLHRQLHYVHIISLCLGIGVGNPTGITWTPDPWLLSRLAALANNSHEWCALYLETRLSL